MAEGKAIIIKDRVNGSKSMELTLGRCLRLVPGRRAVYEATYEGRSVIAKMFLSSLSSRRHLRRELKGFSLLKQREIASPRVLAYGTDADGTWTLVLEKIDNIENRSSILADTESAADKKGFLGATFSLLARMHQAGIIQRDLHLDNFLWDQDTVYALDCAQMRFLSKPVDHHKSIRQLALLSAMSFSSHRLTMRKLLDLYFQERGWKLDDSTVETVEKLARKAKRSGVESRLKKTLRTCTQFIRHKIGPWRCVFKRHFVNGQDMPEFLNTLDDKMRAGKILKNGTTCFVSKIDVSGLRITVKRYNHLGLWHSLRHTFKGSRAKKCWLFGHRLQWLGIPVAAPFAYIEKRRFGIVWQSYILNEFIDGQNIREHLRDPSLDDQMRQLIRDKVDFLLMQLSEHKVSHGDLKATNILIRNNNPILIDLDSMRLHFSRRMSEFYLQKMRDKVKQQSL